MESILAVLALGIAGLTVSNVYLIRAVIQLSAIGKAKDLHEAKIFINPEKPAKQEEVETEVALY